MGYQEMKHGVGRSGILECGAAVLNKGVRKGFTVKVTVEQKPGSGKEVHYVAMERGLQVEGKTKAKAMGHRCVGWVGGTAEKPMCLW